MLRVLFLDPNWKSHPGRENKSTCAIVTISSWDWFKKYEREMIKKRGDEYEGIKKTLGHQMIEQVDILASLPAEEHVPGENNSLK